MSPCELDTVPTFPAILWRLVLRSPSGWPRVVEVRATSEASAVDRVRHWLPEHEVLEVSRRPAC